MKFSELAVLLPCHSLEDFPLYHEGAAADELLVAWTALWHPSLVTSAQAAPTWHRIDMPPEGLAGRCLSVAPSVADRLPAGFTARVKNEGGHLVRAADLPAAVASALGALEGGDAGVPAELAEDFFALGFCRLQMELLTRQMRYSTNIDETYFSSELVAAAQATVAGDEAQAREHLQACFDTLYDSRKHFYPVDVHLLDVTLLAETTLGEPLRRELASASPVNLMATSATLRKLQEEHPDTWCALLAAIDDGRACVLGGEVEELELPLLPMETGLASLVGGAREYESLLGRPPQVYARRRAGLWPVLPQLLSKLAYTGALHFTLDHGRFPLGPQCKTRWEGLDSSVIDIFARVPADANQPESFLSLSRKLSDSMDSDHVATVALAHWPGASSRWYDVLRRVARWSGVLGKFMLLDDYFSHTDIPGRLSKFEPDEYRTPYLKQAIIRRQEDPLSKFVRAHQAEAQRAATSAVTTMRAMAAGQEDAEADAVEQNLDAALQQFAASLPRAAATAGSRYLVVNPLSLARRMGVELPVLQHPPAAKSPVVAAAEQGGRNFAIVDVPAMGFAWVEAAEQTPASGRAKPIAEENVLRNEFLEATISRNTGGIAALYNFKQRGNRLSQQIAFRLASADAELEYTVMKAESVEITLSNTVVGEIVSRGVLVDATGQVLAHFRQATRLWAGSRTLEMEIELDDVQPPRADPWNSYYAVRFAWPDETAELWRGVGLARQRTESTRLEAPDFVEIDNGAGRITLLTGGLPYHRRSGERMLDSLLVVRGETARRFRLGIGVDLPQPAASAVELLTPPTVVPDAAPRSQHALGWFFHLSVKSIVATRWEPLYEDATDDSTSVNRRVRGFRARLLETAGYSGRVTLRTFRPVISARQVSFTGETILELGVTDDRITLDFAAYEWVEVEAVFA